LAKERSLRPRSAAEVIGEIDSLLAELGDSVSCISGLSPVPRAKYAARSGRRLSALVSLCALGAGGVFAWQWSRYEAGALAASPRALTSQEAKTPSLGVGAETTWLGRVGEVFRSFHFAHVT